MAKKVNPATYLFLLAMALPVIMFLFINVGINSAFSLLSIDRQVSVSSSLYFIALGFSFAAFLLSVFLRKRLFIKGEIPANIAVFLGELLIFPFLLVFPPSYLGNSANVLVSLDVGIIITASITVIIVSVFKPKEFPVKDAFSIYFAAVGFTIFVAIWSILAFAYSDYLAAALSHFAAFTLFVSTIYTFQLAAYRDKINIREVM